MTDRSHLITLTDEAFEVSKRTRSLYREVQRVHRRLGTPKEQPGDLDRILEQVQLVSKAITATVLYRNLLARAE